MAVLHWSPLVLLLCACAWADIVMHNPRGSNNRLNEDKDERNNDNRLFDSQNNDRGGYNVGDATDDPSRDEDGQYNMKYFQSDNQGGKSFLEVEWTNQHGCGDISDDNGEGAGAQKRYCDLVMQYMCQPDVESSDDFTLDTLRNGDNTNDQSFSRLSSRSLSRSSKNSNVKKDRGLHESWDWYKQCYVREANGGLFVADQDLKTSRLGYTAAIHTRQDNNGGRSGYECNEERDYWPYWQVSPWVDAAVLTSDMANCGKYKAASTNTETKGRCFQEKYKSSRRTSSGKEEVPSKFIDEASCNAAGGKWFQVSSYLEKATDRDQEECTGDVDATSGLQYSWRVPFDVVYKDNGDEGDVFSSPAAECLVLPPALDCQQTDYSRMNHQGNTKGGQMLRYKWVLPYFPSGDTKRCAFRIRYNISTFDYEPFSTFSDQNGDNSPVKGNPDVDVIADNGRKLNLQIALNTDQYGRTFQDRSHVFKLLPREGGEMEGRDIYNLNVRGRRGNIVQTFPSVEYDFTPNDLKLTTDDLVHIQWTGSNTNPRNQAGQGKDKTDRSNLVPVNDPSLNVPIEAADVSSIWSSAEVVWTYFGKTDITPGDLYVNLASSGYYRCKNKDQCTESEHSQFILSTTQNNNNKLLNNELDNAPASYGGVVLRFTDTGSYWFMCTRNNNFTNRSQKGGFTVSAGSKKRGVTKMEQEMGMEAELEEAVKRLLKTLDN